MNLRELTKADLSAVEEIDGTINSARYLHLQQEGEGVQREWKLQLRSLREIWVVSNPMSDEQRFFLKAVAEGIEEGAALVVEHEQRLVGLLAARALPQRRLLEIEDLRVDWDFRRQGLAQAMMYQLMQVGRQSDNRALAAHTVMRNDPANQLLLKCGFTLAGLDTHHASNHDWVEESSTLFWYAALEQ